ncbi:MAG TPA: glycosyltransferase [Phycicoccus sp.]|nr:glycosyltransferase [Phycicoccus sp.]
MKIAMVSEHASPLAALGEADAGGQNVHVAQLSLRLARLGHDVRVYTRRDDPGLPERVPVAPGVVVVHVPAGPAEHVAKDDLLPYMDGFADWLVEDWRRTGDPDVVHGHFWMSGLAALSAGRARSVPVVQTFHALGSVKRRHQKEADTSPPERADLEPRVAHEVDTVVATCRAEVDELERLGVPTHHVEVVPCGVDTEVFTPDGPLAGPEDRADAAGRARLLAVGRLVERKGFDLAVRALAALPDAELVLVGGPPEARLHEDPEAVRLRALADSLGVGDRVTLTGSRPQEAMPALYRSADVVLATPWYEPFGITPLEAAACGRPVVGAAVGGLLDSVEDGVTGVLVPPRDVPALVAGVRRLLDDPEEATRMGRRARARAVERFDWSVVAERTETALAGTIARSGRAPARRAWVEEHAREIETGMRSLVQQAPLVTSWGERLATTLVGGGRLLAAGNGGSAAEAQHLTAELVGRWCTDRRPLSAIALTAETSSLTAILNDYGPDEVFARQVAAHGRPGDVLVLLSTSGTSSNVIHAAKRGLDAGMRVWAMTGPAPNPLAGLVDEALVVDAPSTAAIQEVQLVAIHAVCAALDAALTRRGLMEAGPVCRQAS